MPTKRDDGTWQARWRTPDGKRPSKDGFTSRKAALLHEMTEELDAKARAEEQAAGGESMTWGEWKVRWLAERIVEANTSDSDLPRISKWLMPQWSERRLDSITDTDVQDWVDSFRKTKLAAASVHKVYFLFAGSMTQAVRNRKVGLAASPCGDHIALPEVPKSIGREFSIEDFNRTLAYIEQPYRVAIDALPFSGMRVGEMAGLHWARVDEAAGGLHVLEVYSRAASFIKGYPKDRDTRFLPLPDRILDQIKRPANWREPCGVEHWDLGHKKKLPCPGQLVFTGPRGAPLDHGNLKDRHWYPALALAGVEQGRLQDLRHTFATWMARAGVPIAELAAMLGHSETWMSQRYSHLAPTYGEKTRAALNALGQHKSGRFLDAKPKLKIVSN
jgi:integrase